MEIIDNKKQIIGKLFPQELFAIDELEKRYPIRNLIEGAMVTRIAPSPTGFMHIGGIYAALISERFAKQTNGIFYLRVEDTDKKREMAGALNLIYDSLGRYGIIPDECEDEAGKDKGDYGPYKQSERAIIYQSFIKTMVEKGIAYPCFTTSEELDAMRAEQEALGMRPGYYGRWAEWRDRSEEDVLKALDENKSFVIRFRSDGDFNKKIMIEDLLLGKREHSENDQDIVIMKTDGLPTYHMAHVIDDHLMRTTHVLRANEWYSSLALHIQLFRAMDWKAPKYGHIFPIQKMDGASKRKLSKRKDPEANVAYYAEQGYPEDAVIEYLLNLANSNFEDWRKANQDKDNREFVLTMKKLASSNGPLFDFIKLNDISKGVIARYSAEQVYEKTLAWAEKHDQEFATLLKVNAEYTQKIMNIERNDASKARKDIAKWSDVKTEIAYFFDDQFNLSQDNIHAALPGVADEEIKALVASFQASYDEKDDSAVWFEKIKTLTAEQGYAINMKEYKAEPEKFKGSIADAVKVFRVLLTGRAQTPDLYSIMRVMGRDRVIRRMML